VGEFQERGIDRGRWFSSECGQERRHGGH
jgi:hypothetical protein